MGIRERVKEYFLKEELGAMDHTLRVLEAAYRRGPYALSEADLMRGLQEAESWLIDYVLRQRGWSLMTGTITEFTEGDRLRAVDEARYMYRYDVGTKSAVNMWTDFGFGRGVEVVPEDEALGIIWDEFWGARRNQPLVGQQRLHRLSNQLVNDGELFFVFFGSKMEGLTTLRRVDTKDIARIVTVPGDPDIPLWYIRSAAGDKEVWYPDWRATPAQLKLGLPDGKMPKSAIDANDLAAKVTVKGKLVSVTSVRMMHVMYDEMQGRGWPMLAQMYEWSRILRNFLGDRAAVAKRAAMFVDEITHSAGSRATDAIASTFNSTLGSNQWGYDTNPAPPAGSTMVHNQAVEVARRPLTTGAGDAMGDGQMFASQVSVGSNIPLHWLGWPQALSNRATAREMKLPWVEQLNRYQRLWQQAFIDMVEIVGVNAGGFETYAAEVNLQAPLDVNLDEVARSMTAITGAMGGGAVDTEQAVEANNKLVELTLQVLGIPAPVDDGEPVEDPDTEERSLLELLEMVKDNVADGRLDAAQGLDFVMREVAGWVET